MTIRIVKMTFRENEIETFLSLFDEFKNEIALSKGCLRLDLLRASTPNVFSTYSLWSNESYLNDYRESALFKFLWPKTKALFAEPPEAISYECVYSSALNQTNN